MKTITLVEPKAPVRKTRKKVAAYARVSMDTERMKHSISAQVSYYSKLIQSNPEWAFAGVYADYGISGTSTRGRDEFNKMLDACEEGKIDIILTKSIQRFARNTVDLLNTVRHLKEKGIEVRFEKESINTLSGDGELMLSILASFAQEEARSISENYKWGLRKRFQTGEIGMAAKHILGYRYDEELRKYVIIPEEAEIVRWIFQMYLEGTTLQGICDALNDVGIKTVTGKKFVEGSMVSLIKNEIYGGDILRQKQFTEDPFTHRQKRNRGELPQYLIKDAHEAILDRETYEKVQAEIKRRGDLWRPEYPFCGMIKCACCGQKYSRTIQRSKGKARNEIPVWYCRGRGDANTGCRNSNFREDMLERITMQILGIDEFSEESLKENVREIIVQENGNLEFRLPRGSSQIWKNLHLGEYGNEHTRTDIFSDKIRCGKCNRIFRGNVTSHKRFAWACSGRRLHPQECDNAIYQDRDLRRICAHILDLEEFDEAVFDKQIAEITINEDIFEFHFTDGRTVTWQKM